MFIFPSNETLKLDSGLILDESEIYVKKLGIPEGSRDPNQYIYCV
jgi:hypothetical protein